MIDALPGHLSADPHLRQVIDRHGPVPVLRRPPGFASMVLLILEQQVSLDSGRAVYDRIASSTGVSPQAIADAGADGLRAVGVTRQKARAITELAAAVNDETFAFDDLEALTDDEARTRLVALRGVGPWTADVYLIACLDRDDVWPIGDRALQVGCGEVLGLAATPGAADLGIIGDRWRPHRTTAARVIWHHYLSVRGRSVPG